MNNMSKKLTKLLHVSSSSYFQHSKCLWHSAILLRNSTFSCVVRPSNTALFVKNNFSSYVFCVRKIPCNFFPIYNYVSRNQSTKPTISIGTDSTPQTFETPWDTFFNLGQRLEAKLNIPTDELYRKTFTVKKNEFECKLRIVWPKEMEFSGVGTKKKRAQNSAALHTLQWLFSNHHINARGEPLLKQKRGPNILRIPGGSKSDIRSVLQMYQQTINPLLQPILNDQDKQLEEIRSDHPIFGSRFKNADRRFVELKPRLKINLPITDHRNAIVETVQNNRITLIRAETGSGKSTQVPQFILDDQIAAGKEANCNIAVSQFRRIAAISLATRVAEERGEKIGTSVGCLVKLFKWRPLPGGTITYFSAGTLVRTFIGNPNLEGISHVFLDEAHHRTAHTDALLTLLKCAMRENDELRLIIMSATIESSFFESYFSEFGNLRVLDVPGRTFPVKQHFIEDLPSTVTNGALACRHDEMYYIDTDLVVRTIQWIDKVKSKGAILAFVTSWQDMMQIQSKLQQDKHLSVIPVHSMTMDYLAAFKPCPPGKRKVIIATNVAETSVTFPDVVYVIDCGLSKQRIRYHFENKDGTFVEWICQSNVIQRKGRAGRVQRGESFHLFTKDQYDCMMTHEEPGIFSDPLEMLILDLKAIFPNKKTEDVFSAFPDPPSSMVISKVITDLQTTGFLDNDGNLTDLGRAASDLTVSLSGALSLLYASVFGCLHPTLAAVVLDELKVSPFRSAENGGEKIKTYDDTSDHLANSKAFLEWKFSPNPRKPVYGDRIMLANASVYFDYIEKRLNLRRKNDSDNRFFAEQKSSELVKSMLLQGFTNILICETDSSLNTRIKDLYGTPTKLRTFSVNYGLKSNVSVYYLLHLTSRKSDNHHIVNETSQISAMSLLLFLPVLYEVEDNQDNRSITKLTSDHSYPIIFRVPAEHLKSVRVLREAFRNTFRYFLKSEILGVQVNHYELMVDFRTKLINCLEKLLEKSASAVGSSYEAKINYDSKRLQADPAIKTSLDPSKDCNCQEKKR